MRILLSIKPEYVEQIERHTKLFEFRKQKFKNVPSEILIYASAPVKRLYKKTHRAFFYYLHFSVTK